jgi:hypothetical protein
MNKNKIIKIIIISSLIFIVLIYIFNLVTRMQSRLNIIDDNKTKITKLEKSIKKEKKNKYNITVAGESFLKNAYFDKKTEYFEDYTRQLFGKYQVKIKIYQSKMDEKEYAEIYINFKSNVYDFFKLLNKIENGDKLVIIKDISVSKKDYPDLDVNMKLGAYYKKDKNEN